MAANLKRMSLEKAIKHEHIKAEDQEREAQVVTSNTTRDYCLQCAFDHRQLAAWLTELKNRRKFGISRQQVIEAIEEIDWYHVNSKGELVHG